MPGNPVEIGLGLSEHFCGREAQQLHIDLLHQIVDVPAESRAARHELAQFRAISVVGLCDGLDGHSVVWRGLAMGHGRPSDAPILPKSDLRRPIGYAAATNDRLGRSEQVIDEELSHQGPKRCNDGAIYAEASRDHLRQRHTVFVTDLATIDPERALGAVKAAYVQAFELTASQA